MKPFQFRLSTLMVLVLGAALTLGLFVPIWKMPFGRHLVISSLVLLVGSGVAMIAVAAGFRVFQWVDEPPKPWELACLWLAVIGFGCLLLFLVYGVATAVLGASLAPS